MKEHKFNVITLVLLIFCMVFLPATGLFSEEVKIYPDPFDQKIILETDFQKVVFDREDAAKIVGWKFAGKEYINEAEKGYGLAKDTFWSPRRLHFKTSPYILTKKEVRSGGVILKFQGRVPMNLIKMGAFEKEGWLIEKTYTVKTGSPEITVNLEVKNAGKESRYFSFWFHNWLNFGADYILFLSGRNGIISYPLPPMTKPDEIVFPVENAPYTAGNEKFEKELRLETIKKGIFIVYSQATKDAFTVATDYKKLLQEYTNFGGNPTLEFMTQPCTLKPGDVWRLKTTISFRGNMERGEVEKLINDF